jgi:hypothetical protein
VYKDKGRLYVLGDTRQGVGNIQGPFDSLEEIGRKLAKGNFRSFRVDTERYGFANFPLREEQEQTTDSTDEEREDMKSKISPTPDQLLRQKL